MGLEINEDLTYVDPQKPYISLGPAIKGKDEIFLEPWPPKYLRIEANKILLFEELPEPTYYSK